MWIFCAFRSVACSRSFVHTRILLSTETTEAAPLDNASKPMTPLPANKSKQCASVIVGVSQLNRVSRARSGVGRNALRFRNSIFRPRHCPPTIRTLDSIYPPTITATILFGCMCFLKLLMICSWFTCSAFSVKVST